MIDVVCGYRAAGSYQRMNGRLWTDGLGQFCRFWPQIPGDAEAR